MSPTLSYPSGLSRPYPTIPSRLLLFPRIPSPTYLPLHPYPTLAFTTLRSAPLASSPLSPTLPYHIHPDRSRGRNVSFPTSTLTLPYSTLPYRPNTPYPTLPIYFLPFHSSTLASHPLRSSTISYCTLPSPPLSSPLFSHLPLSHPLAYLTLPSPLVYPVLPKDSEQVKGQDVLVPECIGAEIVSSFGELK